METMTLTELLEGLEVGGEFRPEPVLCPQADTLTMYFENKPAFAERVDSVLTLFKAFEGGEIVGFEIKGVLQKMQELASLIDFDGKLTKKVVSVVDAKTPKVHVRLLLTLYLAAFPESRTSYDKLVERSREFDDAKIPVAS